MISDEEEEGLRPFVAVLIDVLEITAALYVRAPDECQGPPSRAQIRRYRRQQAETERMMAQFAEAFGGKHERQDGGLLRWSPPLPRWKLRYDPGEGDWSEA